MSGKPGREEPRGPRCGSEGDPGCGRSVCAGDGQEIPGDLPRWGRFLGCWLYLFIM